VPAKSSQAETFFFRDQGQFALLREKILPELIRRKRDKREFRVWSAGCSSGEEPYSIAILLDEIMPHGEDWNIMILGTDINAEATRKAERGIYTKWSFRMMNPDLQRCYFKKRDGELELDESIRRKVKFAVHDMINEPFPDPRIGLCAMDLILCRNVFIYFTPEEVDRVVNRFTETLTEGGCLMTGHGELGVRRFEKLKSQILPGSVVYYKISAPTPPSPPEVKVIRTKKPPAAKAKLPAVAAPAKRDHETCFKEARRFANAGQYDEAVNCCQEALNFDAEASGPYFLMAQIAEARTDYAEAKKAFKKAIYLDPGFVAAYLELGALYEKEKNNERAAKMRASALEILSGMPPDADIGPYEGMTAGEISRHVKEILGFEGGG